MPTYRDALTTRRVPRAGLLGVWLAGLLAIYALPIAPTRTTVQVAEPALKSWVEDAIRRDPALAGIEVLGPGATPSPGPDARLDLAPQAVANGTVTVASSPYVVSSWATGGPSELLGRADEPLDWAALRTAVEAPNGPRPLLADPRTRLGQDTLLLLSLAHYGPDALTLPAGAGSDPALRAWLGPFYERQARRIADETSAVEAFLNRTGQFDVAVVPEHAVVVLLATRPSAQLTVRYPAVNVTRAYALLPGSAGPGTAAFERLRAALLTPDAQADLAARGFRPVAPASAPSGLFADTTVASRGVRWDARWQEVPTQEVAGLLPRDLP